MKRTFICQCNVIYFEKYNMRNVRQYLFLYGLLHDLPRFSLQPSEATEADLDAGQTTGEPDTAGERETCCQGPDDGGVEGVARPQGVHHAPCEGHLTAALYVM